MPSSSLPRALVLGGGGSVGNAWLVGVLAGLHDAGVDLADADLIVGTSAGATAALQITNRPLPALFAGTLAPPVAAGGRPPVGSGHLERTGAIIAASADPADMRRRMGAAFLGTATDADAARWRATVAARMPGFRWPDRRVLLTAVDACTGDPVVFDRDSGVDPVDAVAASTSGAAAYRIGGRWFIDGGYRRNENADLAVGAGRVVVLSPLGGRTRHPIGWGMQLAAQVDELQAAGSMVETVFPDDASVAAFGDRMMDLMRRAPAARAGFAQGTALAPRLAPWWAT